jgi:hypothetical protein
MTILDKKPTSAYDYYRKLVRDFNALEDEIKASAVQQHELQVTFLRVKSAKSDVEQRQRLRETNKWEADRDRQLQVIVGHEENVRQLNRQADELLEHEIRLRAELEVLHERQKAERMTEGVKLRQLIHDKATILEKELTKGQQDLDSIARLIDAAPTSVSAEPIGDEQTDKQLCPDASSPVRALVQNIHERRRSEFEAANRRFQEQLAAFAREQEALKRKADDIRTRKQRALQILSSNQQEAVKDFFTSSAVALDDGSDASSTPTSEVIARHARSLDFADILDRIDPRASTGTRDGNKEADWRQVEEALEQARALVEGGADRLMGVEQTIARRQQQAQALDEVLHTAALAELHRQTLLSMPWTIDTCPPELCQAAYLARNLILQWVDTAVDNAEHRRPDVTSIAQSLLSDTLIVRGIACKMLTNYSHIILTLLCSWSGRRR